MERHHVALLEESILVLNSMHTGSLDDLSRTEGIVGIDLHAKALGDACHIATHVTKGQDAQLLTHELGTRLAIVEVTNGKHQHTEHQLGNSI